MIPITKPFLGDEEVAAAKEAILSGWVSQGPKVKEFEEAFASSVGAKFACAVTSATAALHLALKVIGVERGDQVITVSHSFISTANAIRFCGAEPLFVDIDLQTFNISPEEIEKALKAHKKKVTALLVVHQIGMPCDLAKILPLAKEYGIPVIEDAACAIGSKISLDGGSSWEPIGKPHGDIACFSFHPRKVITTGEGGMLTTNNEEFDKAFRLLRHQGMNVSDTVRHESKEVVFEEYTVLGYNYRMTDIQAAIGIEQLKKLPDIFQKRREIAQMYSDALENVSWLKTPAEPEYCKSNWQSYAVRVLDGAPLDRNGLMQKLLDVGIATRTGIMNSHQETIYRDKQWKLPISEEARDSVILLPLYAGMSKEECQTVIRELQGI